MTAERYAVTVYSRATANGANQDVENWAEVSVTATAAGAGKLITLSTASGASPAWPGPGAWVQLCLLKLSMRKPIEDGPPAFV